MTTPSERPEAVTATPDAVTAGAASTGAAGTGATATAATATGAAGAAAVVRPRRSVAADDAAEEAAVEAAMRVELSARRPLAAGQGRRRRVGATLRRAAVSVIGLAFLLAGAAMVVLPGPGLVAIAAGLAVLATEFAWAERRLHQCRDRAAQATTLMTANPAGYAVLIASALSMLIAGTVLLGLVEGFAMVGITLQLSGLGALAVAVPGVRRKLGLEPEPAPAAGPGSSS